MLHSTQEMLSVARNIGEFIVNNVAWDHVCMHMGYVAAMEASRSFGDGYL